MQVLELENFHSIRERQVIDLRVAANVPDPENRFAKIPGGRVPRVVSIFGPNAAGKSTVLRGLALIAWFVQHSFHLDPGGALPLDPFATHDMAAKPTILAIRFKGPRELGVASMEDHTSKASATGSMLSSVPYRYEVAFRNVAGQPSIVLHERLDFWPSVQGRSHSVFKRDAQGNVSGSSSFPLTRIGPVLQTIRPNASVISTLSQFNHPQALALRAVASNIFSNILVERQDLTDKDAVRFYAENPGSLAELNDVLERLDVGIRQVSLAQGPQGTTFVFEHKGLDFKLPMFQESNGTRAFLKIFPAIHAALMTGGLAVIDELDLAIHPLVMPEIFSWFTNADRNTKDAQLWFTCQNAAVMDFLDKEEIFLCEKDRHGGTEVFGLRDMKAVRRSEVFSKKYLGGVYGAVPRFG